MTDLKLPSPLLGSMHEAFLPYASPAVCLSIILASLGTVWHREDSPDTLGFA